MHTNLNTLRFYRYQNILIIYFSVILFIMLYIFYCRNRLSASEKEKYLNDLLGDENDPENIYLSDSDDDEYFPEDQCPISDTEETTGNIFFNVLICLHVVKKNYTVYTVLIFRTTT